VYLHRQWKSPFLAGVARGGDCAETNSFSEVTLQIIKLRFTSGHLLPLWGSMMFIPLRPVSKNNSTVREAFYKRNVVLVFTETVSHC
jgi:hypothetical protein